ncbi:ComF family protein [Lacibacterium aquatile]|uniref:ComF family protein n=1 Tax=Lacibacterium aquatile TaxID=1168082 RepID=A0ABW5DN54_9PROT
MGRAVLDLLLPPRCLNCRDPVSDPGALCPACWNNVRFISAPLCDDCGWPKALADEDCTACARRRLKLHRVRSAFFYDDDSRGLILRFKHGGRFDGAPAYAGWLARAAADLMPEVDVIVPVPLHRFRLMRRGYNQAALLARHLGRLTNKPVDVSLLRRIRSTPALGGHTAGQRMRLLKGVFALRARADIVGKRILLVDDVLTSGATLEELARVLRRGGAKTVDAVTLARVPLSED